MNIEHPTFGLGSQKLVYLTAFQDQPEVDDRMEGEGGNVGSTPTSGAVQQVLLVLDPPGLLQPFPIVKFVHFNKQFVRPKENFFTYLNLPSIHYLNIELQKKKILVAVITRIMK